MVVYADGVVGCCDIDRVVVDTVGVVDYGFVGVTDVGVGIVGCGIVAVCVVGVVGVGDMYGGVALVDFDVSAGVVQFCVDIARGAILVVFVM